jgi:bifunctional DNA-binding transcriptional regulator/antitoxin component of YhaV-PrlF toxin-antitoxin module
MVKLQFDNNQQFKITLPKQILLAKGWKKGDKINIELDSTGNLILKKK